MENVKMEQKKLIHVAIDKGIHKEVKKWSAESSMSIKALVEGYIADGLHKDGALELSKNI